MSIFSCSWATASKLRTTAPETKSYTSMTHKRCEHPQKPHRNGYADLCAPSNPRSVSHNAGMRWGIARLARAHRLRSNRDGEEMRVAYGAARKADLALGT